MYVAMSIASSPRTRSFGMHRLGSVGSMQRPSTRKSRTSLRIWRSERWTDTYSFPSESRSGPNGPTTRAAFSVWQNAQASWPPVPFRYRVAPWPMSPVFAASRAGLILAEPPLPQPAAAVASARPTTSTAASCPRTRQGYLPASEPSAQALTLLGHRQAGFRGLKSADSGVGGAPAHAREGAGMGRYLSWGLVVLVVLASAAAAGAATRTPQALVASHRAALQPAGDPTDATAHDVSPPLAELTAAPEPDAKEKKEKKQKGVPVPLGSPLADPVVQATEGTAAAPALGVGFEGVGQGFTGPAGTFQVRYAPPDTNGAVGPNHYVQIVNTGFAIFTKSGTPIYGPVPTNTLWSGFGGGCQSHNDGDATVVYDRAAGRWIFTQFSVSTTPYLQCVAISTSGDPTGSYYRYSFQYGNFPDYPKLAVWPDAYYTTFNMFSRHGNRYSFAGPEACAYDRGKMLLGQAATQQCFLLSSSYGSLLPADLDGTTAPPAGSPNYLLSFATNSLQLWKFHVDWTTPSSSTLTGPTTIPVASFSPACGGDTCIPQPGTSQQLDSLADRLMYRLAYRNFGDHESLVVDHSVTAGGSVGVRWYELRNPGGAPTVFQQGTYAPDASYRWMGSVAMDHSGD